jgi:two-component system, NarL family, sensor histidine kinase DesK
VIATERAEPTRLVAQLRQLRVVQLLGLLFLVGPLADLARSGLRPEQIGAIAVALGAFVAVYLVLLPPVRPLVRRGVWAVASALAVLLALALLILGLGAPRSFTLLFVYVVAVAGIALPATAAATVVGSGAAAVAVGLAAAGSDGSTVAAWALTVLGIGALTASLGRSMRANAQLRRMREERARLAVSEERLRIARDLHDLLGHTLSVVALKTELAARLVEGDPRRAQQELADVQRVARGALAEVRGAVRGYRRLAFSDAVDGAHATLEAAGIDCRVDVAEFGLPDDVETALAWAVREAATNVVRHSNARTCEITLTTGNGSVVLQVDDDGAVKRSGDGTGAGLAGLAERAHDLHGTLEASGCPEGGFRLRVTLPVRAT